MATATGPQVGTAWIAITPSFRGFGSNLQRGMTDELTRAARRAGDDAGDAAGDALNGSFADRMSGFADSLSGVGALAGATLAVGLGVGMAAAMDTSAATSRLAAQLDLTADEAQRAGEIAGDVYARGFGGSMGEVAEAVGAVSSSVSSLADTTDSEMEQMTASAVALADIYQWDVADAATAAGQAIENGLAADGVEAFDLLAAAAAALPASMRGDVPLVIQEYSEQFQRLGLDGAQAFGMMSQFVQAGGRDIDQAADVIHEFARISIEETDRAAEAFEGLGLNAEDMLAAIHSGGPEAAAAMGDTLEALRGVEDPAERGALAIELFGDMAGESSDALLAMDPATASTVDGLDDVSGAAQGVTDALEGDPGQQFESQMRTLAGTLGDALMPVLSGVASFASAHPGLFQAIAVAVLVAAGAFTALSIGLWAVNTALLANPVTWIVLGIIAAIALLAAGVAAVIVYWDEIVAATRAAWDWVWDKISSIVQWIVDLWMNWSVPGIIISHWDTITSTAAAAWQWVQDIISGAWTAVRDGTSAALRGLRDLISGAWSAVRQTTSSAWGAVTGAIVGGLLRAWRAVSGVGSWFTDIGRAIVNGIASGVLAAARWLRDSVIGVAQSALNGVKSFLRIGSPSRMFADEVGQWIPAGVQVGVEAGTPELTQAIDHMVQVPDPPTVRATVATGTAATAAPTIEIVAGDRHLMAWLESTIRTQYGGDITRVGAAR
ncbi:hypothetical protein RM844_30365 [Streptomyces sp. DSM 44915]|uniref:Phage tail tape measure protein domain-containing protein n=1 Tax=Streptomyces chisholmiae TaxID=3075540 RepID=A0ABU2K010_9ACTN|nr:phage tail tape measure protein [Streptomyces sp. DSM 44915]MDT0270586.1 hypothetical protein [Streptomyces sp. DSM 44915]